MCKGVTKAFWAFVFGDKTKIETTPKVCIKWGDKDNASFAFRKEITTRKTLDENKSHFEFGGFKFRKEMET